jgi:small neutral amino acid transporter SnatA (MarC family)
MIIVDAIGCDVALNCTARAYVWLCMLIAGYIYRWLGFFGQTIRLRLRLVVESRGEMRKNKI